MSRLMTSLAIAVATWAVRSYLSRNGARGKPRRHHIESWENEGGALAPQQTRVETSQVPR